jgi:hypothetical protein
VSLVEIGGEKAAPCVCEDVTVILPVFFKFVVRIR